MSTKNIFIDTTRSKGDFAGVLECDIETCYFYVYSLEGEKGKKVLDAIHVSSGISPFEKGDVKIKWNSTEERVGLFIHNELWAAFDIKDKRKFGGNYRKGGQPDIPVNIAESW